MLLFQLVVYFTRSILAYTQSSLRLKYMVFQKGDIVATQSWVWPHRLLGSASSSSDVVPPIWRLWPQRGRSQRPLLRPVIYRSLLSHCHFWYQSDRACGSMLHGRSNP